ncbi:MAG: TetR/AcrR family transcriptional regulator [Polyangiaceae bacterium]
MRYPEGHKEEVRKRILAATAKALRAKGLDGVSIPMLMKAAGLTHGGFYSHFENRDELVAEAIRLAAETTDRGALSDDQSLAESVERYLSPGHVAHPEMGCVLAALGSSGPKQQAPVRRAFADVALGFIRGLERKLHPASPAGELSDEALAKAATLVGAVMLARLLRDKALAGRLLEAAKRHVLA